MGGLGIAADGEPDQVDLRFGELQEYLVQPLGLIRLACDGAVSGLVDSIRAASP